MAGLRWWVVLCVCISSVACAAAQAPLLPVAAAYDTSGNLYYVDANRNQVFELASSGTLTVFAGTGTQGFGGDGGSAIAAKLNWPQGIAITSDGTIYIADTGNQRIRKIVGGAISTFAGTGIAGFSGDGVAASAAQLRRPTALAVDDGGDLIFCDAGNERIREIAGGTIRTIAGNGIEGFSGDGGSALNAELDGPDGIAVAADGHIVFSDTRNQRVRAIDASGQITTLGGNGEAGFSGDGGAAVVARLHGPRGLSADGGVIYVADADNQRVRAIDSRGNISTVAGAGVQGTSVDGSVAISAMLNLPIGVAVGPSGVAIVDSGSGTVRLLASDGNLYAVVPVQKAHVSLVKLQASSPFVYGQGVANVTVSGSVGTPSGDIQLLDSGTTIETAVLASGSAEFDLSALSTGAHQLQARYSGDAMNVPASSALSSVTVTPASLNVTPSDASMAYGAVMPALTGAMTGVLPRDSGNVSVMFVSAATALSPVGSYPITAELSGTASGNYSVTLARTAHLMITQAATSITFPSPSTSSYAGLPLLLSASITSTSSGTPSGEVAFADNGVTVVTQSLQSGVATATYLSPAQGAHSLTASYSGDTNFAASASVAQNITVAAMPDFALSATTAGAVVQGGLPAQYVIGVEPAGGTFTGLVTLSAQGVQPGATVTFSPATVVPGATGTQVTMTVQTVALASLRMEYGVLAMLAPFLLAFRRRRYGWLLLLPFCFALNGCGARTVSSGAITRQSYPIMVTGTATNLAGQVVRHAANVTLTIE